MRELNAQPGNTVGPAEFHDPPDRRFVGITVQAQTAVRNAPLRRHVRCLENKQAAGTHRKLTVVHQVPVVGRTIVGHVLAHGRDGDPVWQRK